MDLDTLERSTHEDPKRSFRRTTRDRLRTPRPGLDYWRTHVRVY